MRLIRRNVAEVSPIGLLRENGTLGFPENPQMSSEEIHREKVMSFLRIPKKRENPVDYKINTEMKQILIDNGFSWFVDTYFIRKLPYVAGIGDNVVVDYSRAFLKTGRSSLKYVGDVPDSIMDKASLASATISVGAFTVHSMKPMVIEMGAIPLDPIMIGWCYSPGILTHDKKFFSVERETEGVVIGIWDHDKEIEIL